jgi:hypothetical protein
MLISFASNSGAMLALAVALACGGSTAQANCNSNHPLTVEAATASSVESNHFVAEWAVDGDPESRWASEGVGADNATEVQWLELYLGGVRFIDSITLNWETASSHDYDIQVSMEGEGWETVLSFPSGGGGYVEENFLNVRGSRVRIFSREGDPTYGISLFEVNLFGDSNGNCNDGPGCAEKCQNGDDFDNLRCDDGPDPAVQICTPPNGIGLGVCGCCDPAKVYDADACTTANPESCCIEPP